MEEKERYIIYRFDGDIFDTKKGYYPSNQTICEIINQQDKQIKELQKQLALTEKALELACKELRDDSCMRCNSCNRLEMCDYVLSLYPTSYFIEEAKEMLENE